VRPAYSKGDTARWSGQMSIVGLYASNAAFASDFPASLQGWIALSINGQSLLDSSTIPRERGRRQKRSKAVEMMAIA
jgi:hypothetical protein